ncbi:MAG: ATP-dependent sacrificial sulfur transferase LarE [Pseudomonadota bacterium]
MTVEKDKYRCLLDWFSGRHSVAVAFSGGVDSTLLLKAASVVHGEAALAFFARSSLQKSGVEARVVECCRQFGVTLSIVDFDPLSWSDFTVNGPDRCYLCKKRVYSHFLSLLPQAAVLVDGTNVDDLSRDRPGLQAIKELGIRMPLVESGLAKDEIRSISKELSLASWDLPTESCLAARIVAGVPLSAELLGVVKDAESYLEKRGFRGCRVRLDGASAFVTLFQGDRYRLAQLPLREDFLEILAKLNYAKVFLDLSG